MHALYILSADDCGNFSSNFYKEGLDFITMRTPGSNGIKVNVPSWKSLIFLFIENTHFLVYIKFVAALALHNPEQLGHQLPEAVLGQVAVCPSQLASFPPGHWWFETASWLHDRGAQHCSSCPWKNHAKATRATRHFPPVLPINYNAFCTNHVGCFILRLNQKESHIGLALETVDNSSIFRPQPHTGLFHAVAPVLLACLLHLACHRLWCLAVFAQHSLDRQFPLGQLVANTSKWSAWRKKRRGIAP